MSISDTHAMLKFRSDKAKVPMPFDEEGVELIFQSSKGVPRDALKLAGVSYKLATDKGLKHVPVDAIEAARRSVPLETDDD